MKRAILVLAVACWGLAGGACGGSGGGSGRSGSASAAEESATADNDKFQDKMREIARLKTFSHPDDRIREILMKTAREHGLAPYIAQSQFVIETREERRKITCEYERQVEVSPGNKKTLRFKNEVDESYY